MAVNRANVAIPQARQAEMMAVVGMADQTKVLASGLQIDVAAAFQNGGRKTLLALIADSGKIVQ